MRETEHELRATIVEAVREVEPELKAATVRKIVEGLTSSKAELTRLARTLRRDASALVEGGGVDCAANIEPLIKAVQDAGGRRVVMPKCALCERESFRNLLAATLQAYLPCVCAKALGQRGGSLLQLRPCT